MDSPAYFDFVDARSVWGIPNAWNVLSNLPFLLAGGWGLCRLKSVEGKVISLGVALTCLGSSLFHWSPNFNTLFWDRLPMAVAFMGILALVIGDRIDLSLGSRSLPFLVLVGIATVVNWQFGNGDLRPYLLVQYCGLSAVLLIAILIPGGRLPSRSLIVAFSLYALAKALESHDGSIFQMTGEIVSGHSLKHLLAALGVGILLRRLALLERSI